MREISTSSSEGWGIEASRCFLPLYSLTFNLVCDHERNCRSQIGDRGPTITRECLKEVGEQELTQRTFQSGAAIAQPLFYGKKHVQSIASSRTLPGSGGGVSCGSRALCVLDRNADPLLADVRAL
jgi:hypothetical protein